MKKYVIEMNKRQARILNWACDTLPRLIEGQGFELQGLFESAWERRCKKATGKLMDDAWDGGWQKMREDADKVVNEIKKRFWGLDVMTDNGIHYDDSADIIWDMHQVLRHELWKNRPEPKPRSTVDAFPGTRFGDEPLISVWSYDPEEELKEKIKKVSVAGTREGDERGPIMDITRNARWTSDCCGKQDLDFEIIHADTRYWPDLTAICTIYLCPGKYYKDEGFIEEYDAVKLVESDYIRGDNEEDVKVKVRGWYNEHILEALEKAITLISGSK